MAGHILFSGRFDNGEKEAIIRKTHASLLRRHPKIPGFIVRARAGGTFGQQTIDGLTGMKAMAAFCWENYGEKTESSYSTFAEVKHAVDYNIPIIPLKFCKDWPPAGGNESGRKQNLFAFKKDVIFIDLYGKPPNPDAIADLIAEACEGLFGDGAGVAGNAAGNAAANAAEEDAYLAQAQTMDANGDGVIARSELRDFLQQTYEMGPLEIDRLYRAMDGDGDGKVTVEECAAYLKSVAKDQWFKAGLGEAAQRKLKNPHVKLTEEESITVIEDYLCAGEAASGKAENASLVMLVGNTGAGKSTFINYLHGCTMESIASPNGKKGKVIGVAAGETPLATIGFSNQSATLLPDLLTSSEFTYCDCPGFGDNRGPEINIANAANIMAVVRRAAEVRVIFLVNYNSFKVDRGKGSREVLEQLKGLFGDSLGEVLPSILVVISRAPPKNEDDDPNEAADITAELAPNETMSPELQQHLTSLSQRALVYHPLNKGHESWAKRVTVLDTLKRLTPIQNPGSKFSVSLLPEDELLLRKVAEKAIGEVDLALTASSFEVAAASYSSVHRLGIVGNDVVAALVGKARSKLQAHAQALVGDINAYVEGGTDCIEQAEGVLGALSQFTKAFCELDDELRRHCDAAISACKPKIQDLKIKREDAAAKRQKAEDERKRKEADIDKTRGEVPADLASHLQPDDVQLMTEMFVAQKVSFAELAADDDLMTEFLSALPLGTKSRLTKEMKRVAVRRELKAAAGNPTALQAAIEKARTGGLPEEQLAPAEQELKVLLAKKALAASRGEIGSLEAAIQKAKAAGLPATDYKAAEEELSSLRAKKALADAKGDIAALEGAIKTMKASGVAAADIAAAEKDLSQKVAARKAVADAKGNLHDLQAAVASAKKIGLAASDITKAHGELGVVYYNAARHSYPSGDVVTKGLKGKLLEINEDTVKVQFEGHDRVTNITYTDVTREDPRAPFKVGTAVFYVGERRSYASGDTLSMGMKGVVKELAASAIVKVQFEGHKCVTNINDLFELSLSAVKQKLTALHGHILSESSKLAGWYCDGCRASGASSRFRCIDGCDFDLCGKCFDAAPAGTKEAIKIGDQVRVKSEVAEPKFNWGRVSPGEVGVVKSVDLSKGQCRVDFVSQGNWLGVISEMEVVVGEVKAASTKAGDIKVGDRVSVKPEVERPKHNWGQVKPGHVGVVVSIDAAANDCRVDFPCQKNWRGALSEMFVVEDSGAAGGAAIKVGDNVRVKPQVSTPKFEWGQVKPGMIGVVRSIDVSTQKCRVDFPPQENWLGFLPEMEVAPKDAVAAASAAASAAAGGLKVGDRVRVKSSVSQPKYNWGKVTAGEVGTVRSINASEGECRIDFESQANWLGVLSELEPAAATTASCPLSVGDSVRVKSSVSTPKHNWGKVSAGSVGVVASLDLAKQECRVNFDVQQNWLGYIPEMEVVGKGAAAGLKVGDSVRVKRSVATPKHNWGKVSHGDVGVVKSIDGGKQECRVDFPVQQNWLGALSELEHATEAQPLSEWKQLAPGTRVKLVGDATTLKRLCNRAPKGASESVDWVDPMTPFVGQLCTVERLGSADMKSYHLKRVSAPSDRTFAFPYDAVSLA